jgi:diacylglycerol kinase (ATP)
MPGMEESPFKGKTGFARVVAATGYSLSGLAYALKHESSFRIELGFAAVMIPLGLWLGPTGIAKALLVGSVLFALTIELLNSAVEAVVDRVSLDTHPLAKRAKDLGSAAVMFALATAAVTWTLVLWPSP